MTPRVLLIGGSDQGRQTIDILEERGDIEIVGVLDDALPAGADVSGYPVLGGADDVARCATASRATAFVVALGDNLNRARETERVRTVCARLELLCAIHPRAVVARDAVIGPGCTLMAGAVVSNGSVLGTGVLMGTNSSLDHDGVLGDFASLAPGATTGGTVRIGDCTAIGLGANVIHQVTIGDHTVIGAGALVLDDVPDRVVAFGSPARVQRTRQEGDPYLERRR